MVSDLSGTPAKSVFMDLTGRVDSSGSERGLLGLAFHPNYDSNGYLYVFYTADGGTPRNRISRFTVTANPNVGDTTSELILIDQLDQNQYHNAGALHFGPDGYLYASFGDEGGGNDQFDNTQQIDKDFFSSIIRIDVDKRVGNLEPNAHPSVPLDGGIARYSVPADNPFVGATHFNGEAIADVSQIRTEFYIVGLRNPFRFSIDPITARLFLGDVGQNAREEIHLAGAGDNCGWKYREGTIANPANVGTPPAGFSYIDPIFE